MRNSTSTLICFLLTLLMIAEVSYANGGPVAWSSPTVLGTLEPIKPAGLALLREKLVIRVNPDGLGYTVNVDYLVRKDKAGRQKISFALPIAVEPDPAEEGPTKPEDAKALVQKQNQVATGSVKISLGGKTVSCQPVEKQKRFPELNTLVDPMRFDGMSDFKFWCAAEVTFPEAAGEHTLTLQYKASFFFNDDGTSKSPFTNFGPRHLFYPLAPAHSWAAEDFQGELELHPGLFTWSQTNNGVYNTAPNEQANTKLERKGEVLTFSFGKAFLKSPGFIKAIFKTEELEFREIANWNKSASVSSKMWMVAKGNTFITPEAKYGVAMAIDGDPTTAWCFKTNVADPEIILRPAPGKSWPRVTLLMVAAGYLKNDRLFRANGQPTELEFSTCDGKWKKKVAVDESADFSDFRKAWIKIHSDLTPQYKSALEAKKKANNTDWSGMPEAQDLPIYFGSGCVKIRITKIKPGKEEDTCISEIIPLSY